MQGRNHLVRYPPQRNEHASKTGLDAAPGLPGRSGSEEPAKARVPRCEPVAVAKNADLKKVIDYREGRPCGNIFEEFERLGF